MADEIINIDIQENAIEVAIEKPELFITMEGYTWDRGVWITKIVDNGDGTFTRTYGDGATEITTIDLRWHDWTSLREQTLHVLSEEQVFFVLSAKPSDLTTGMLFINGLKQQYPEDYVIWGMTLTRLNRHFKLNTTDVVEYIF